MFANANKLHSLIPMNMLFVGGLLGTITVYLFCDMCMCECTYV